MIRFVVGGGLVCAMVFYYGMGHHLFWQVFAVIIALYPLWTSVVGWDPLYALSGIRSGGDTGRNQVGMFPFQVKAALGTAPAYTECQNERSLEACHYSPHERPLHPSWRVNREPILYPDRERLDEYFRDHPLGDTQARKRDEAGTGGSASKA